MHSVILGKQKYTIFVCSCKYLQTQCGQGCSTNSRVHYKLEALVGIGGMRNLYFGLISTGLALLVYSLRYSVEDWWDKDKLEFFFIKLNFGKVQKFQMV